MKKWLITALSLIAFSTSAFAANMQYSMKVDGMTCKACVKKVVTALKTIEGVGVVKVDWNSGMVTVCADEKTTFTDAQLKKIFEDKGFSYRSMKLIGECS